ncbi:MAG: DNA-directed RNA polymerase subunit omega [Clostridia bacterium]|nr:DNA-directed RNA polymerase subunit omega [Clostridia bacterium]
MIKPSVEELTHGKYNRFTLVLATAKSARMVTDEYIAQREKAEQMLLRKETDKPLSALIPKEYRDDKAVKTAIRRLHEGDYVISNAPNSDGTVAEETDPAPVEEETETTAE